MTAENLRETFRAFSADEPEALDSWGGAPGFYISRLWRLIATNSLRYQQQTTATSRKTQKGQRPASLRPSLPSYFFCLTASQATLSQPAMQPPLARVMMQAKAAVEPWAFSPECHRGGTRLPISRLD